MKDAGKKLRLGLFLITAMGLLAYGCSGAATAMKEQPSGELAKLENLSVSQGDDVTTVLIELEKPLSYTTVRVDDPPMVVVDVAGVDMEGAIGREDVAKGPVLFLEKSRDEKLPHVGRIGIGLSSPVKADVTIEGSTIVVRLDNDGNVTLPGTVAGDESDVETAEVAVAPAPPASESAAEIAAGEPVLAEATMVHEIKVGEEGGLPYVAIRGDGKLKDPKVFMLDEDESNVRLVVDVFDVDAYTDNDTIIVGDKLLKRVRVAAHDEDGKKFRVVLDLGSKAEYDVKSTGGDVVVALAPAGGSPVAKELEPSMPALARAEGGAAVSSRPAAAGNRVVTKMDSGREVTVTAEAGKEVVHENKDGVNIYISQVDGKTILSSSPIPGGENAVESVGADANGMVVTKYKIYSGGRISFDLQDAKLDKVIKLLADVAGLNLLMNPSEVQGVVTLKLQNVPWDQALDILLRLYDLDKVIEGNVLRVAPSSKLSAEEKRLLREKSEMMQLVKDSQPLYTKTFKINYVNAEDMEGNVKKLLTKRGEITPNTSTNELIVTDIKDTIGEVEDLIKLLDKRVNQIMIEARIVTVSTGFTQSLGLSWGVAQVPEDKNNPLGWGVAAQTPNSLSLEPNNSDISSYVVEVPAELGVDAAGLVTGMTWLLSAEDAIHLDVTLSALETISKAETLAAPKVLTLENEQAMITQGTTLYVQTTSASGTKPEPLNANLSLTVTPRVTGDNYIVMDVNATNNAPASATPPGSTAAIDTQAVQTKVIVKDGDTIVLGGIYIKRDSTGDNQVPWLGRIPILGWLFKERNIDDSTQELLIFITPKIMPQGAIKA